MFFQTPTPPSGGGSSGGVTDRDLRAMEDRIVRAIESGFSKVKIDKGPTQTDLKKDGYYTGSEYSGREYSQAPTNLLGYEKQFQQIQAELKKIADIRLDPLGTINEQVYKLQVGTKEVFSLFGQGRDLSTGIASAIGDARFSIMEMGGDADTAFRVLQEALETTNRTNLSSAKYVDELYATTKVTGQSIRELVGGFDKVGMSAVQISGTMKDVVDYAASVGLNVKAVSDTLIKNFDKLNLYNFQGGVQGLTRMAAQATMLKMDMSKTLALADELLSPEKAMDMAAGLQRLGVSTSALIDPLRLMDMAQNDPEQLQKEIVNLTKQYTYFNEETKKTEILPGAQRYLRELAPMLGLTKEELANMAIQSGTIERKLSEIKMPGVVQTEEDKMLFANLAELNKEGKYEITYKDAEGREKTQTLEDISKMTQEGQEGVMKEIRETQKLKDMDMKDVALKQLSAAEQTNKLLLSMGAKPLATIGASRLGFEAVETAGALSRTTMQSTVDTVTESLGLSTEKLKKLDDEVVDLVTNLAEAAKDGKLDIEDLTDTLKGAFQNAMSKGGSSLNDLMNEQGEIDSTKLGEKLNTMMNDVQTKGLEIGHSFTKNFTEAAEKEIQTSGSKLAKAVLSSIMSGLGKPDKISPEETETAATTNIGIQSTDNSLDEELGPQNETPINNTNTNNLKGEDVTINNNNYIDLLGQDTALVGRDGMMAGTDLMGLKDRFGDMSNELSKSLLSGVEEIKSGFKSILGTSPTLFSRQTETGIEPKLLSDNLNVTLNPELAPEFAKIRKEVREMGENIPLDFKFTLPKFEFNFGTEENMNSYLEFKKRLEDQLIKPNIQTEENKIKFTTDKVEGMEKIDSKLDEVKNTKIEIPTKIDDKDLQEPLIKKVETTFDDTKIKDMSESLFSEKRLNIGFEFENRDEFEKLSKEFDEITKEKNIHLKQDKFEPNIPKEETIKIKTEQEEFKSNVPQEQISNLKFEFDKEKTNSLYDQINEKFGEPFHLKFDQEEFESNIPKEQTIKINTEQEKFESKIPEEQKLKLDYEFSNKSDFEKMLDDLYKTKDPYQIKFESEKFEPNIPKEETIKIKTDQEEFKTNIPKEETLKLDYQFLNKSDFDSVIDKLYETKNPYQIKFESEKFEPNIPKEETIKIKTDQEEFKTNIPKEETLKLDYEFSNKSDFEKMLDDLYKTKDPYKIKFESEKFESNIPKEETIEVKSEIVNQKETEDLLTKMTSDKEFKLFTNESSLVDINKNVSSIFDKDFFVKPKMENMSLSDTKILEDKKLNLSFNFENQNETETLINKMSSDKEFKLFTDTNSLTKESEKVSSIFDNEIKLQPKIDEGLLKDVSLPKMEQEVSLKQPEESEMDSLKQKFENSAEQLKSSFRIPTSLVDNLSLTSGLNRNEYSNTNLQSGGNLLQNENTNNFNSQSTTDVMMRMLTERFATPNTTTNPTVQPVSTPREIISPTTNLGSTTNNTKMEFGELKIVHEIKVSSGNVDPSVVGQAFTQLTRDPSFVKTLETKIKDLQGGMGQQAQMNPMTA